VAKYIATVGGRTDVEGSMDRATAPSLAPAGGTDAPPKRSPLSRVSFGHVLMMLAGLLAVLLNLALLRGDQAEQMVTVADRDLATGTRVGPEDLRFVSAPIDGSLADRFVTEAASANLVGLVVTRPVSEGDPLFESDVRPEAAPDAGRAMSVPVDATQAVAGALQRGDRVDVIGVQDGVATYIAVSVEVLAVPEATASGFQAATGAFSVTLAVDDTEAIAIAAMLDVGAVHIVRSTGAPEPTVILEDAASAEPNGAGETSPP